MRTRILTGIVAFLIFLPFLIFSDTIAFPIAMTICSVISVFEMLHCVKLHKNAAITVPLLLVAAATPLSMLLWGIEPTLTAALAVILTLQLYVLAVTTFSKGKIAVTEGCTALMACTYIIAGFSSMVFLHDFHEGGRYLYLLTFIGAWVPDTFAYFTGMLFGKHKLIPDVSPKKTVEGAVGGLFFCTLAFVGFALIYNNFLIPSDIVTIPEVNPKLPVVLMAVIGLLSGIVSMVGDLTMSLIKRHYGIKDYGRILPGHGGFLDRFDSVIAVAVILAVFLGATIA
jgi:phosphatidate cytidylyltransferase